MSETAIPRCHKGTANCHGTGEFHLCPLPAVPKDADPVERPAHYTRFPEAEVIQIAEHLEYNLGAAVKYAARAGFKSADAEEDIKKARWHLERELRRLQILKEGKRK